MCLDFLGIPNNCFVLDISDTEEAKTFETYGIVFLVNCLAQSEHRLLASFRLASCNTKASNSSSQLACRLV